MREREGERKRTKGKRDREAGRKRNRGKERERFFLCQLLFRSSKTIPSSILYCICSYC
jgi:hypothetical protein